MILSSHGLIASSISGVDADWLAYYNRVIAAGGSLTTTEQNATKTLVADLKANSLWTPMLAVYPMVGASAAACAQNLKSSSFTGTFTSGWTFSANGVQGNGTSAYFNTTITPLQMGQNSVHFSCYTNENSNGYKMGIDDSSQSSWIRGNNTDSSQVTDQANNGPFVPLIYTQNKGFVIANRVASLSDMVFNNNVKYTRLNTSGGRSSLSYYVGAYHSSGGSGGYTNAQFRFNSFGDGLTDTQASNFYTAVQAFQTTLSRAIAP